MSGLLGRFIVAQFSKFNVHQTTSLGGFYNGRKRYAAYWR